ncbi:sugar phosphate nucleotidyltransferase [Rubrobacter aplysinae]|uniref:sugar phosphate nucleotidyltransferase n=1 Tax=Rubrobacter aplysinae TaxID=909625 RepID=UPI00064B8AAE|nr:NDP-sugar synthase [Rubrobacter aplysinae]
MKAVILVGGQGSRLRPITYHIPKALVPLRNQPFMGYMVEFLRRGGLDGAVLSLGYLPDPIQAYFADRKDLDGFSLDYAVEDRPLGTAGGLKNAEPYLDRGDGPLVVVNGDVLTGLDLGELLEAHRESGAQATITLTSVEDPTAYGLVEVDSEMQVHRFLEKPAYDEVTTNLVNAGIYVLEPEVLEMIPADQEVSIEREIFPELQARGTLRAHVSSAYWRDVGTPRSYLMASHDVLSGAVGTEPGFEYLQIDASTKVGKGVKLLPPLSIAPDCVFEEGATVGGRSSLGRGCRIGRGATVEGSVVLDGAEIEPGAVVRGSVIGPEVRVGQDAIVRGLSVLGAEAVIGEGNVLDQGLRVNPGVVLQPRSLNF